MNWNAFITCAITGAGDTVGKHPAIPVTPAEIADSAVEAARAGAAVVHLHVRDPETKPYQSGGGAPYAETSMRGTVEAEAESYVDGVVTHVRELPALLDSWYA